MGKHQVVAVTIVAGGGNDQTCFKQAPAVDTLGIILHDIVFGNIVYPGHNLSFPVTLPAEIGNIHLIGTRPGVGI